MFYGQEANDKTAGAAEFDRQSQCASVWGQSMPQPDRTVELRIWTFERVCSNEIMSGWSVNDQIIEADRIVAWLKGEGDGGQKTPDRAAA